MVKFELVEDPEVIRFTHIENGLAWSSDVLTREEYADREHILGQSEVGQLHRCDEHAARFESNAKHLGIRYFVLKDLSLPETSSTSQIVASCETLNRVGWAIVPGTSDVVSVLSVCIGGVFTLKDHRGRGYAKKMIDLLNDHYDSLAESTEDPFLKYMVVFLYSEVGEYYAKMGYKSYHDPLYEVFALDALEKRYCDAVVATAGSPEIRTLGYDDYEDLVERQRQQFKKKMVQANDGSKFIFTLEPTLSIYKWFEDRDIFLSKKFQDEKPERFGATLPDGSHIVWHHSWIARSLYILKVHVDPSQDGSEEDKFAVLLKEAIKECRASTLQFLEFWQDEIPGEKFPKFHTTLRLVESGHNLAKSNGSLSAIRLSPACQREKNECLWLNNTKFCWF